VVGEIAYGQDREWPKPRTVLTQIQERQAGEPSQRQCKAKRHRPRVRPSNARPVHRR